MEKSGPIPHLGSKEVYLVMTDRKPMQGFDKLLQVMATQPEPLEAPGATGQASQWAAAAAAPVTKVPLRESAAPSGPHRRRSLPRPDRPTKNVPRPAPRCCARRSRPA